MLLCSIKKDTILQTKHGTYFYNLKENMVGEASPPSQRENMSFETANQAQRFNLTLLFSNL